MDRDNLLRQLVGLHDDAHTFLDRLNAVSVFSSGHFLLVNTELA